MNEPKIQRQIPEGWSQQLARVAIDSCDQALWIFDFEKLCIVWANSTGLRLWRAQDIDELGRRDLVVSDASRCRFENYKQVFREGRAVDDVWTVYPLGHPVTVRCHCTGVRLPDGRHAMLVCASQADRESVSLHNLRSAEVLRHTSVMITLFDESGTVIMQNPAAQNAFGVVGEPGNSFLERCCDQEVGQNLLSQLCDGQSFCVDIEVRTLQGTRWHALDGRRTVDPDTGKVAIVVDERDATERKLAQDALRASENQFRVLCMEAPIGIFLSDARRSCTFVNQRWCELTGLSRADALGPGWKQVVHPDDRERVEADWRAAAAAQREWHMQYRFLTPTGQMFWVVTHAVPMRDEHGEFTGYLGVVKDITQTVLSEQRFALLFEHSSDAHLMLDESGSIIDCNLAAVALFEAESRQSLLGIDPASFSPALQRDGQRSLDKARDLYRQTSGTHHLEWLCRLPSGREFLAEVALSAANMGGETVLFVTARDVTEKKQAEEAILRSREAALEASRGKSQFLANMSHEIRTPMNGVLGMLQLALGSELSQEQREYLQAAHASAEGLLEIINDILDLSKIEAGKLDIDCSQLSVHELLRDSLQTAALRAHAKGIELIVRVGSEVPSTLRGDPVRLRQVLTNLLVNAVKFTEAGHVLISLSVVDDDGGSKLLACCVEDTGIGIAPDRLVRVFEAFQQADGSTTRRYGGTGLGLTICRELITRMGGQLWASSVEGQGSCFHFSLPLQPEIPGLAASASALAALLPVNALPSGKRVLVIDDHPLARATMVAQLEAQGRLVLSAANAEQALAMVSSEDLPIEAAFIDHALGSETGLELARLLRRFPACRKTRFVLLRSHDRVRRAQLREADFEFALDKPVLCADLRAALLDVFATPPTTNRRSLPAPLEPARKLRALDVLMVEDHPVNAHFLGALLHRLGHHVVHAWNGARALSAFAERTFDIVLMDVQMPEMDGLEATRRIREKERGTGRRVPIVALTANAMKGDEDECLAAGMDHYLSKPISPDSLQRMLERVFAASIRPGLEQPVALPSIVVLESPVRPPFLREQLLERAAGDPRFMGELIQIFLTTQNEMVAELEAVVTSSDCQAVRNAAHRLKGALELVCAGPAAELAAQLETAARQQQPDAFRGLLRQLLEEMQRLRLALGDGSGRGGSRAP